MVGPSNCLWILLKVHWSMAVIIHFLLSLCDLAKNFNWRNKCFSSPKICSFVFRTVCIAAYGVTKNVMILHHPNSICIGKWSCFASVFLFKKASWSFVASSGFNVELLCFHGIWRKMFRSLKMFRISMDPQFSWAIPKKRVRLLFISFNTPSIIDHNIWDLLGS